MNNFMQKIKHQITLGLLATPLLFGPLITPTTHAEYILQHEYELSNTIFEMPSFNYELFIDPDYGIECNSRRDEKRKVIDGNLTLSAPNDFEKFRCIKRVTGNLYVEPNWDVDRLVIPWLESVGGNLILEGSISNVKALLPKLHTVSGRIEVNNRQANALWSTNALKNHKGEFRVVAGVVNNLKGFDALTDVGKLKLRNHPNDIWGPFYFTGLDGLTTASSIDIVLRGGATQGTFLSQLTTVNYDVEISLHDSALFGLSALETIGGSLEIMDSIYTYNLNMFANLLNLGGLKLTDSGFNDVSALSHLSFSTADPINIIDNYGLGNCAAKTLVRQLRNNPSFNSFNSTYTKVYGNGYPDC